MTETSQAPKRPPIINPVRTESDRVPRIAKTFQFGVQRKPEHVLKQMRLNAA